MKDVRYDRGGKLTAMATADGYVMVRRPRCMPFVVSLRFWSNLPKVMPC